MERLTYLATKESDNDIVEHIENQLQFKQPITKSILGYFQMNPVVIVQPQSFPNVFQRITNVLIQHPQSLQQLVLTALDPERVQINSAKQACVSAKILKHCPKLLLFLLQRGNDAVVLFDFLKNVKNQTSLGYFNQIFDHQSQEFQNSVIKFFAGSSLILQVFMVVLNSVIRSGEIGLIQFKKQIFLRFLSLSTNVKATQQLVQNIMDMMGLILQNIFTLKQTFLQMVFDNIPEQIIQQIGQTIIANYKDKCNTVQYLIRMISYIVDIYKAAKSRNNYKNIISLQKTVIKIVKVFQKFMPILKDKPVQTGSFPNGQLVPKVGLVRYYLFTLFKDILSLNQKIVIENLQFNEDKHKVIQIYLCLNKWNNMMHYLVEQCAVLLLKYERIRQEKIKYTRCKEFLNFLIQQFKASQYFFLQTSSISSYGNIYFIYNIARAVAVQLQNTSQLRQVLKNFKPLQKFITADLQNFQLKMDGNLSNNSSYMINSKHDSIKKLVRKMTSKDIQQAHVHSNSKKMMKEDEFIDYQNKRKKRAQDKMSSTF